MENLNKVFKKFGIGVEITEMTPEEKYFSNILRNEVIDAYESVLYALNSIQNIDFYQGVYYNFFNNITFGLERIMKLTLLFNGQNIPTNHDLSQLFKKISSKVFIEKTFELFDLFHVYLHKTEEGRYKRLTELKKIMINKEKNNDVKKLPETKLYNLVMKIAQLSVEQKHFSEQNLKSFKMGIRRNPNKQSHNIHDYVSDKLRMYVGEIIRPINEAFLNSMKSYKIHDVSFLNEYLTGFKAPFNLSKDKEFYIKTKNWSLLND